MTSSTYCDYPHEHLCIDSMEQLHACCVATPFSDGLSDVNDVTDWWYTNKEYNKIRKDLDSGIKNDMCNGCWKTEDLGLTSMRLDRADNKTVPTLLRTLEITAGRTCNLACRMCTPWQSNQIYKYDRPWFKDNNTALHHLAKGGLLNWMDNPVAYHKVLKIFKNNPIEHVYFTGGEPQLIKSYQNMLEDIDKNIGVHFNTNATVYNEQFFESLDKFSNIQVDFSVDAVGPMYDLIRVGGSYEEVKKNILRIIKRIDGEFRLVTVAQLANVNQGQMLQHLYDTMCIDKHVEKFQLLPVNDHPEWRWENLPIKLLQDEYDKIEYSNGEVIKEYKIYLKMAIENNTHSTEYASKVIAKEEYFKSEQKVNLFEVEPSLKRYF